MANEIVRVQIRKNDTEHTWNDVGNKAGDESIPVNGTVTVSNPTDVSDLATSAKQDTIIAGLITSNPFSGYGLYAVDSEDATYFYAMYQNTSAAWIVIRITLATGITLYATGSSDASGNWTGRAGLTYQDYDTTFS